MSPRTHRLFVSAHPAPKRKFPVGFADVRLRRERRPGIPCFARCRVRAPRPRALTSSARRRKRKPPTRCDRLRVRGASSRTSASRAPLSLADPLIAGGKIARSQGTPAHSTAVKRGRKVHPCAKRGKTRYHSRVPPRSTAGTNFTRAFHHGTTKYKRTMRAGRRRARRPHGSVFCCATRNKKNSRGPRVLSDRRPSNRPRAKQQPMAAASAGRLNHKITCVPIGVQNARLGRGLGRGARSGTPPQCKRPSTSVEPAKTKRSSGIGARFTGLHRSVLKTSVRASPVCIGLPSKHRCAIHRSASFCPQNIGARFTGSYWSALQPVGTRY